MSIDRELRGHDDAGSGPSAIKQSTPSALCEAGISHMLAGRYVEARLHAEQALAMDPAHADALHLIGLLCIRSGQYDHAVEWIGRAIRQNPTPDYLSNLGTALRGGGRLNEALQVFDKDSMGVDSDQV